MKDNLLYQTFCDLQNFNWTMALYNMYMIENYSLIKHAFFVHTGQVIPELLH